MATTHGAANYCKPREKMMNKKALIGPVTAVALHSSVDHEYCFSLVAKGSWVELTVHGRVQRKDYREKITYRELLMRGHEGGTVHGLAPCTGLFGDKKCDILVFHGGRYLGFAFIDVQPIITRTCPEDFNPFTILPMVNKDLHQLSDWIWDIRTLVFSTESTVDSDFSRFLVAVGLAHNTVEIWSFESFNGLHGEMRLSPRCVRKIICETRCITYSMSFFGWRGEAYENEVRNFEKEGMDLVVAVGTVSNEILLWNIIDEGENINPIPLLPVKETKITGKKVLHRLIGHAGVVYSVKFGAGAKYIVTTSDDRTVRLWGNLDQGHSDFTCTTESSLQVRKLKNCKYQSIWIGYGHTARVWNSDFILFPGESKSISYGGVATVGEDSTIRLWRINDGCEIASLKGHGSKSVWRLSTNHSRDKIITGGNDGVAKIWDISYHLFNSGHGKTQGEFEHIFQKGKTFRLDLPPDDMELLSRPSSKVPPPSNKSKTSKKPKPSPSHRQIVCGVCFHPDSQEKVLVATRAGMLLTADLNTGKWFKYISWMRPSSQNEQAIKPMIGSCIAIHPSAKFCAIGTANGQLVLAKIKDKGEHDNLEFGSTDYPAIQSLHWIDRRNLLAFHIKGISVWWSFTDDYCSVQPKMKTILTMAKKGIVAGIPMCYYYDELRREIFIGDSRGNLGAFDISNEALLGKEHRAVDILCYTHKKEYVTGVIPTVDGKGLLSVGNDGFIHETAFVRDKDGRCIKLASVIRRTVPYLTGIQYIFRAKLNGDQESIIVGGYRGNNFIIWDTSTGYQLLCLDTGGRNRHLDLSIRFKEGMYLTSQTIALYIANKNGPNELLFHSNANDIHEVRSNTSDRISLGSPCHGETIFDVTFCATESRNNILFLSGSNDCTAKLYQSVNREIFLVSELPHHESCIRAVCCSKEKRSNSSLLVVCGGKLITSFYRLDEIRGETFKVTFLCTNQLPEKPTIDQRMNAVCAIPLIGEKSGSTSHLVVSGDSDGSIHLNEVTEIVNQPRRTVSMKLAQDQRPILSIDMKRICMQHIIACVGNTRGDVAVWLLPGSCEIKRSELPLSPAYVYRGHQTGSNCLSLIDLHPNTSSAIKKTDVAIASGGDDQSICICLATIEFSSPDKICPTFKKNKLIVIKESCLSAIKGIKIAPGSSGSLRVYAAGYDQKLSMWSINPGAKDQSKYHQLISSCPVDIKDVNALDLCTTQDPNGEEIDHLITVGEGLDYCAVKVSVWKAAEALKKCDFLLITVGAGFSSDSDLPTYEKMPEEYKEFCNPMSLRDQPMKFQKYWCRSSRMYAEAKPHAGYEILAGWCGGGKLENLALTKSRLAGTSETSPWWIYSSNVDGLFGHFPCFSNTVCEIHGNATKFRCSHAMGNCDGVQRCGEKWKPWHNEVESSNSSKECVSSTYAINSLCERKGFKCPHCSLPLRPNVLMFHDTDTNVLSTISKSRQQYQEWEAFFEDEILINDANAVILELGAGKNVPAVRNESEEVFRDSVHRLNNSRAKGCKGCVTFIRINPNDAGFDEVDAQNTLSIYETAEKALTMIDHILTCSI